jgi:hypothetical protein
MWPFNSRKKKNEQRNKMTPAERYLQHLDNIFQKEPKFHRTESMIDGIPGVTSIIYEDIPEKGFTTAFTYGLSLVNHPAWEFGRPELCISVESPNSNDWGQVVGYVANKLRGECPFGYGEIINFHERISDDSEMDAFFVFAPSTIGKEHYLSIDVGTEYKINIACLYPMYSSEVEVFHQIGIKSFWHHPDFDNYSIKRKRIVG